MAPGRPALTIARAAAWAQRKLPFRLTSRTPVHSSSRRSRNGERGEDARVVHEDVERAERRRDRLDHPLRVLRPRHVARHQDRAPATGPDLAGHRLGGSPVVEVVDADVGTLRGEREGDGAPDPLLRPRDEGDLPEELHRWPPGARTIPHPEARRQGPARALDSPSAAVFTRDRRRVAIHRARPDRAPARRLWRRGIQARLLVAAGNSHATAAAAAATTARVPGSDHLGGRRPAVDRGPTVPVSSRSRRAAWE